MDRTLVLRQLFGQIDNFIFQPNPSFSFGKEVQKLRKTLRKTQTEFAKELKISQAVLSDIENNKVRLSDKVQKTIISNYPIFIRRVVEGRRETENQEKLTLEAANLWKETKETIKILLDLREDQIRMVMNFAKFLKERGD